MGIRCAKIFLLLMVLSGCKRQPDLSVVPPDDIAETNVIRRSIGIRQIKKEWTFDAWQGIQSNQGTWKSCGYVVKSVVYNNSKTSILEEYDNYYSGATWVDNDGKHWECFVISYDYFQQLFYIAYMGKNPIISAYFDDAKLEIGKFGYRKNSNDETLQLADKILEILGKKRFG